MTREIVILVVLVIGANCINLRVKTAARNEPIQPEEAPTRKSQVIQLTQLSTRTKKSFKVFEMPEDLPEQSIYVQQPEQVEDVKQQDVDYSIPPPQVEMLSDSDNAQPSSNEDLNAIMMPIEESEDKNEQSGINNQNSVAENENKYNLQDDVSMFYELLGSYAPPQTKIDDSYQYETSSTGDQVVYKIVKTKALQLLKDYETADQQQTDQVISREFYQYNSEDIDSEVVQSSSQETEQTSETSPVEQSQSQNQNEMNVDSETQQNEPNQIIVSQDSSRDVQTKPKLNSQIPQPNSFQGVTQQLEKKVLQIENPQKKGEVTFIQKVIKMKRN